MEQLAYMNPALRAVFAALIEDHRRLVFKVAHAYGRGSSEVEDLAQEIAAQAWRSFASYDSSRKFSTWLYRVALNVAISWLRTEGSRRRRSVPFEVETHDAALEDATDISDGDRILRGFIDAQTPLDRALLLLYLEERSNAEIAEILGISATNVTTKIGRLKDRLRAYAETRHGTR